MFSEKQKAELRLSSSGKDNHSAVITNDEYYFILFYFVNTLLIQRLNPNLIQSFIVCEAMKSASANKIY